MKKVRTHSKKNNRWKIIFLVYADLRKGRLHHEVFATPRHIIKNRIKLGTLTELEGFFETVKSLRLTKDYEIYVLYNRIQITSDKVEDKTFVLKLVEKKEKKWFKLITRLSNRNFFQKPFALTKALRILNEFNPAYRTLLFTWGHGSSFGIFKELNPEEVNENREAFFDPENKVTFQKNKSLDTIVSKKVYSKSKYFERIEEQEADKPFKDILSNDELGTALQRAFTPKKVDIVVMMNCGMQNIFTCFSLKDSCKYLIAPMGSITVPGYNYSFIIDELAKDPYIPTKSLAGKIISSIGSAPGLKPKEAENWAIFAAKLSAVKQLISFVDSLAEKMINIIDSQDFVLIEDIMGNMRTQLSHFDAENYLVDFKQFTLKIATQTSNEIFTSFKSQVEVITKKMFLPEAFIGVNFQEEIPELSGSGILYPQDLEEFFIRDEDVRAVFFNSRSRDFIRINKKFKWVELLDLYFKKIS